MKMLLRGVATVVKTAVIVAVGMAMPSFMRCLGYLGLTNYPLGAKVCPVSLSTQDVLARLQVPRSSPRIDRIGHRPLIEGAPVSATGQCNEWRRVTSVRPAGVLWRLGFRQSSFHRIARVLRNRPYNAFRP